CDHCLPLYNDKPFRQSDQVHAFNCKPCECNSHSRSCHYNISVDPFPFEHHRGGGGVCDDCEHNTTGLQCDTCREHFYGLDTTGCKACDCNVAGSRSGTVCDARTGQCICNPNVGGRRCSECLEGYFYLQRNNSFLCLPCNCDRTGTVNGSLLCDKSTGQCLCKLGVTGLRCDQCEPHRYHLTVGNSQGCQMCECDPWGTLPGTICDPISGQCLCLPRRRGRRCNQCQPG
ncbi:hypothetical protein DBR06_SOUSAS9110007, partial [Sousa chinensis]